MMKKLVWLIFILLVLGMGFQGYILCHTAIPRYSILELETSCKAKGQLILHTWNSTPYGNNNLLSVAQSNTHWDFLFILCYVTLIIIHSSGQMQNETSLFLNELLRLNLLLAVLAGLLDISENLLLLHNFRHISDGRYYWPTAMVTIPKFVLAGWAVLIWLISLARSGYKAYFPGNKTVHQFYSNEKAHLI